MFRIIYMSRALKPFSHDELSGLLSTCRENNARHGVTGMLLYFDQNFIQILEGEEAVLDPLMDTIRRDPRHTRVTVLERSPIKKREFSNWSMGFKQVGRDELGKIKGFGEVSEIEGGLEGVISDKEMVSSILRHFRDEQLKKICHEELPAEHEDPLIRLCHLCIRGAVRVLAVLMTLLIFWAVLDVIYILYQKLSEPPVFVLSMEDILATFGAFLVVLIAIEIFINITLYVRKDVIPVNLVVATALMAIARKVIVFDFKKLEPDYVYATSLVVLALGVTYWLMEKNRHK